MFVESLDVFAVHLVDEVGAAVVNRLCPDAAGAQVSEKLMDERQQLRRLRNELTQLQQQYADPILQTYPIK